MIEARNLRKHYRHYRALDDVSLTVAAGETVVLTGGNGSGKTTLLHVLMGLRRPDAGQVIWKQNSLTTAGARAWRDARRAWGFLPQHVALPPRASVSHLLRLHARIRQTPLATAQHWLNRVGLGETRDHATETLSGGMRQRLAIALTLFHSPELIVMDEPDNSLDPAWRGHLAHWLDEASQRNAAVLITSQLNGLCPPTARRIHCEAGQLTEHVGTRQEALL